MYIRRQYFHAPKIPYKQLSSCYSGKLFITRKEIRLSLVCTLYSYLLVAFNCISHRSNSLLLLLSFFVMDRIAWRWHVRRLVIFPSVALRHYHKTRKPSEGKVKNTLHSQAIDSASHTRLWRQRDKSFLFSSSLFSAWGIDTKALNVRNIFSPETRRIWLL